MGDRGDLLFQTARRALADGVPEVAAVKLRELLRGNLDPGDVRAATALLARARLQAGDPAGALAAVDGMPALRGEPDAATDPEVSFWRAQALAALGRWTEALAFYEAVAASADAGAGGGDAGEKARRWRVAAARFGRAEALLALGRRDAAREAFAECERAPGGDSGIGEGGGDDGGAAVFRGAARLRLIALALEAGALGEAADRLAAADAASPAATTAETRLQVAERRLLRARLELARGNFAAAEETLETLRQEREILDERLFAAIVFAQAEARAGRGDLAGARAALTAWIDRYPSSPFLGTAFSRLERLAGEASSAVAPAGASSSAAATDLTRWEADATAPDRQARATLALARARRASGALEAAEVVLRRFDTLFPNHPLRARALLELAALQLRDGRPGEAQVSLAAVRAALTQAGAKPAGATGDFPAPAEIDLLDARVSLARGDLPAAARTLQMLSERDTALAEPAALAATLIFLRAGAEAAYVAAREDFLRRFPASRRRAELPLEEGLIRAAHALETLAERTPVPSAAGGYRELGTAADALRQFLRESPAAPRELEARLALAELALLSSREPGGADASPPHGDRLDEARRQVAAISAELDAAGGGTGAEEAAAAAAERADYLAIWLADAPGPGRDEAAAIAAAKKFLARWPQSPRLAEARLKLGEIYFRREDYADAQTQLELVGREAGNGVGLGVGGTSPALFEHARYLAGLAALRSLSAAGADRAVSLFEDAARVNGTLKTAARLRQAETLRDRLGKPADALRIYESLLAPPAPPTPAATGAGAASVTPAPAAPVNTTASRARNPAPRPLPRAAGTADPTPPAPPAPAAETLENRCALLCGKGETLLVLNRPAEAAETFAELAALPGASVAWRRQALARRGEVLEKTGDNAAALAAYYDALGVASEPGAAAAAGSASGAETLASAPTSDFTWFYRAGFAAARLLKNESRWSSAAAIYTKLAAANGPLQAEVEAQLNQLRLEHFLWPD